jgi:hypothetical protein
MNHSEFIGRYHIAYDAPWNTYNLTYVHDRYTGDFEMINSFKKLSDARTEAAKRPLPPSMLNNDVCPDHGDQQITGADIYNIGLACGCTITNTEEN